MPTKVASIRKGGSFLVESVEPAEVFTPEDFNDEQKMFVKTADDFIQNEVLANIERTEHKEDGVMLGLLKKAGELGLLMIDVPEAYGGLGLDKSTSMAVTEAISKGGSFGTTYGGHAGIGTLPIVYFGTEAQKKKYLPRLATGEIASCYALTEPGSGSDALAARSRAELSKDGKHYVLNGDKTFITNGGFADLFIIFAKIDGLHFSAFIVERDYPGLTTGPEEKKMGIKGSSTTTVILEGARVPVENVLGEIGKGHKIAFNVLNVGRFKLGGAVTGAARRALGVGIAYTNVRKQFGVTISSFGAMREKMADRSADLFASESLIYRLAGMIDDRLATLSREAPNYYEAYQAAIEEYAIECAISKVFCSEMLAEVVDDVVQVHGGYGFTQEYPAERFYRDERINRIFEGTNEINRLLIPGTILRRAMKGDLPITREAMKAMEAMMTPSLDELDPSVPFAAEKATLANLKRAFLVVSGAAVQKFQDRLKDEQEVLLALADVAIQIFAIESAMLRAEKIGPRLSADRRALVDAAVKVFTFGATEKVSSAAKRAVFFVAEGDAATLMLGGVRRFTRYDASGLLAAKKLLGAAAVAADKYPL
jgi:alkylation response protein AidB-like acyl-CoA dehydrogenase